MSSLKAYRLQLRPRPAAQAQLRRYAGMGRRVCVFACVACGHTENADIHAAKNILAAGHAVWLRQGAAAACGGDVSRAAPARARRAAPAKQEPTEAKAQP